MQKTFKALSDPVRIKILTLLKSKRLNAGQICANFDLSGATISYHLNILKEANLIRETKEKNFIFYETNYSVFEEILILIKSLQGDDANEKKL